VAKPEPRPALAKAPDAALHPLSGRPTPAERRTPSQDLRKGSGTAADAITGPTKDKDVDLGVRVPKSVRKRLRAEAKARGITPDELVSLILAATLPPR